MNTSENPMKLYNLFQTDIWKSINFRVFFGRKRGHFKSISSKGNNFQLESFVEIFIIWLERLIINLQNIGCYI